MHKFPVGVLGASGYAGRELCALALRHPRLELAFAAAHGRAGERARVAGREITFAATDAAALGDAAVVFSALPHGASAPYVAAARAAGAKVVDLSADLRPGSEHATRDVPYGLTEITRDAVRAATVVANPGCYPTATLLGLLPLLEAGLVAPGATISVVAASGVTGAGNTPRGDLLFAEVAENFRAYGVGNGHRHVAEIQSVVESFGADADVVFTPHLLPVARGILATIVVPVREPLDAPLDLWRARYAAEPFVEVADEAPSLRDVVHRNVVRVFATPARNVRRPAVIVVAAIDNLVKGAAGQAVQNANLLLGLDEALGLPA
ncbi:MAG TPA: N-acetyl-gamma-glutamyl-phosphate reductase [Gemmatimonadaceae bacterium]|nr:N-acetyl-gamma-glutamyl-phosphate reductase [Gemmatimonadaceae bacterium]